MQPPQHAFAEMEVEITEIRTFRLEQADDDCAILLLRGRDRLRCVTVTVVQALAIREVATRKRIGLLNVRIVASVLAKDCNGVAWGKSPLEYSG